MNTLNLRISGGLSYHSRYHFLEGLVYYEDILANVNFNKAGKASVQVFDMMGHIVESFNENVTAGVNQFSLKNMSTGNYVVRVMMNGASKTARISIK